MDRGAWQATVHGVAKSQTQLRLNTQQTHTQIEHTLNLRTVEFCPKKRLDIPISKNYVCNLEKGFVLFTNFIQ